MKILKKIKLDMWINTIMMVLIGVLFLMNAHDSLKIIPIIIAAVLTVSGEKNNTIIPPKTSKHDNAIYIPLFLEFLLLLMQG